MKKTTKKVKIKSADEPIINEPIEVNDTIVYKLIIHENEYEFSNIPSPGADLVGLIICKRVHETMIKEIDKVKELGLKPEFKSAFNNRRKDLVKSVHTIDKSIKHLFKFAMESVYKGKEATDGSI